MRKVLLATGEYYHIFNRGTDKRVVFPDQTAFSRFLQSMEEFNTIEPIGSIYENSFHKAKLGNPVSISKWKKKEPGKLVEFVCYCLNPNHYHFLLKQIAGKGIEKFMHRLGLGYTKYFNQRFERSGVLFQGPFKAVHVDSNEYLLHLSVYINLNYKIHQLGNGVSKSSWDEYTGSQDNFCNKEVILGQFRNAAEYKKFAEEAIVVSRERKDMEHLFLE